MLLLEIQEKASQDIVDGIRRDMDKLLQWLNRGDAGAGRAFDIIKRATQNISNKFSQLSNRYDDLIDPDMTWVLSDFAKQFQRIYDATENEADITNRYNDIIDTLRDLDRQVNVFFERNQL